MTSPLQSTQQEYWIVLSHDDYFHGRKYVKGLNVLPEGIKFDDYKMRELAINRMHYCDTAHVSSMFQYGDKLCRVTEPVDHPDFKRVEPVPYWPTRGANMIIIGESFSLYDPKTYEMLGISKGMLSNAYIIEHASVTGNLDFLNWWNGREKEIAHYYESAMDRASMAGQIATLNWWKNKHFEDGLKLKYSSRALRSFPPKTVPEISKKWWEEDSNLPLPPSDKFVQGDSE